MEKHGTPTRGITGTGPQGRGVPRALLLSLLLAGCGGGDGNNGGSPPPGPDPDTTAPSVPQAVTATAQSPTEVLVQWQASTDAGSGVAGYRVFRDGGAAPVVTVTATQYSDTGLAPATRYTYTVRAIDSATPANESADSTSAEATTPPSPVTELSVTTERVFASLPNFANPVALLQAPADASRWFVVEQAGRVRDFDAQPGVTSTRVFIDIRTRVRSGGELGLLGMAFHPAFPSDPRVYLSYTNDSGGLVSRISEFRSTDGGRTLDPSSEIVVLTVAQPDTNHNGGNIVFGPDGDLYIGFGDGGGGGDPWGPIGNGQNLATLLGKMLRIDIRGVTGNVPYRIPAGNPHAANALCNTGTGAGPCPEIYAYGFRNPWRWSFDRVTDDLWVADVGQGALEEVDRVTAGGNYGWRCFEGTQSFNSDCGPNAATSLPPIAEYGHDAGESITGGYVYRGNAITALIGRYVFADYISGRLWAIPANTAPTAVVTAGDSLVATSLSIASFGQDLDGELYIVDLEGTLHRLVAGPLMRVVSLTRTNFRAE